MNRAKEIARRWLDVVVLALLGGSVYLLVAPVLVVFSEWPGERDASSRVVLLVAFLLLVFTMGRPFGLRIRGLRNCLVYPPAWLAALLGLGLVAALRAAGIETPGALHGVERIEWLGLKKAVLATSASIGVLSLADYFTWHTFRFLEARVTGKVQGASASNRTAEPSNFDELREWFQTDVEIRRPEDDRFGHDGTARRISQRLLSSGVSREGDLASVAITGARGSGKSSLLALTRLHMRSHGGVALVSLSLWDYQSPEAAMRAVLRAVVAELTRWGDTFSVQRLPAEYARAVEASSSYLGFLLLLLDGDQNPQRAMRRLDRLACAVGVRVIVWVEDMDRFAQLDVDESGADSAVFRKAVHSLLYNLDRCASFSAVVSSEGLSHGFDIQKIARFVERPPTIAREFIGRELASLRRHCMEGSEYIDPVEGDARSEFDDLEQVSWTDSWQESVTGKLTPSTALRSLVRTPRALKQAMRDCWYAWERLAGEVDLDDLLVMSVIRATHHTVFASISDNIKVLRAAPDSKHEGSEEPIGETNHVSELLPSGQADEAALRVLIDLVFSRRIPPTERRGHKPQGFAVELPTDYWDRHLAVPDIKREDSDQAFLRNVQRWKNNSDHLLAILQSKDGERALQFVGQFSDAELCRMLDEVVAAIADRGRYRGLRSSKDPGRYDHPELVIVSRMMHGKPPDSEGVYQTLLAIVDRYVPGELNLVVDVEAWFAAPHERVQRLLDPDRTAGVRRRIAETMCERALEAGADAVCDALRGSSPYSLWWAAWGLERVRRGQFEGEPFERWSEFSSLLLDAAQVCPDVMLPAIAPFVATTKYVLDEVGGNRGVADFRPELADSLFDRSRLMSLYSDSQVPPGLDATSEALLDAVRSEATRPKTD